MSDKTFTISNQRRYDGSVITRQSIYNPAARELCLALAKVCQFTGNWEGARKLQNAAEYLYRQMFARENLR